MTGQEIIDSFGGKAFAACSLAKRIDDALEATKVDQFVSTRRFMDSMAKMWIEEAVKKERERLAAIIRDAVADPLGVELSDAILDGSIQGRRFG